VPAAAQISAKDNAPDAVGEVPARQTVVAAVGSAPIADSDLALQRGGQALTLTDQKLEALVSGNSIDGGYRAGDVTLSGSALSNFNGFGNLVINTGAQTSLQAAMNVTINITGD
jgi:hypothetical protein